MSKYIPTPCAHLEARDFEFFCANCQFDTGTDSSKYIGRLKHMIHTKRQTLTIFFSSLEACDLVPV